MGKGDPKMYLNASEWLAKGSVGSDLNTMPGETGTKDCRHPPVADVADYKKVRDAILQSHFSPQA